MMPRFFKDMPPRKGGQWIASVLVGSCFRPPYVCQQYTVTGLRRAYIIARLLALWLDFYLPWCDGELEIRWQVTSVPKPAASDDQPDQPSTALCQQSRS